MENWDEDKLRKVVLSKHGNPRTTTDVRIISHLIHELLILMFLQIVCKHFIDAIESQKYACF